MEGRGGKRESERERGRDRMAPTGKISAAAVHEFGKPHETGHPASSD